MNKIKYLLKKFDFAANKKKIVICLGLFGVFLILLSEFVPVQSSKQDNSNNVDYTSYVKNLEAKTTDIISSISGVGKCKVMITLVETDENVFAKNITEDSDGGSYSQKSEYVLYEDSNNDTPILVKQYFPKINGVVVVCQGGDDVEIREQVISSISSLYGISSTKISVSKLNR